MRSNRARAWVSAHTMWPRPNTRISRPRSRARALISSICRAAVSSRVSPAKALEQLGPLVGDRVALVVLALGEAEHGELLGVPAGDDVQPEAPAPRRGRPWRRA